MKKFIKVLLFIVLGLVVAVGGYILCHKLFFKHEPTSAFNVVPSDAVFVVETDNLSKAWITISKSEMWGYLQSTPYFADVDKDIELINKFIKSNSIADKILSDRELLVVGCVGKKEWDLLYLVDLKEFAAYYDEFKPLLKYLDGYDLTKRELSIEGNMRKSEIFTLTNQSKPSEKYSLSLLENILVISMKENIVEQCIRKASPGKWAENSSFQLANAGIGNSKMFKFYMNHSFLSEFYENFSTEANEIVDMLDESLTFSAMEFDLNDNRLTFDGYTTIDSVYSYVHAFANVGKGKIRGVDIASQQTAAYFSLTFDDFREFYSSLLDEYKKGNEKEVKDMEKLMNYALTYLGVDITEDFISWIGNEIAIVKLRPLNKNSRDVDMAVLVHANDIDKAVAGLGRIVTHIRHRTPLTIDVQPYRNFDIQYLEMKGFFKMFLGKLFNDIEKPYFTYIEDYVVFANSQEDLKQIIDDYLLGRTLSHDAKFADFKDEFDSKSNVSVFIQMPKLYQTLYRYAPQKDKEGMEKNKDIIYSFARIGFQLTNDGGMFKTSLQAEYDADARLEDESQNTENQAFNDPLLMKIDSMSFVVKLPEGFDKSDGFKRIYYPDSIRVFQEGNMLDGKVQGVWRTYYQSGLLQSAVCYDYGTVDGISYFYYDEREKTMAEIEFVDGEFDGEYLLYYKNGTRKAKLHYQDGKKHGDAEYYHQNGNLRMSCKYKKGEISGKALIYDEKGNKIGKQKLSGKESDWLN